jgi:hypothetical protein
MQRISVALHLTAAAEISRACAVWLCWWCGGCGVDMRPQPLAGRHPTPTSRRAVWFVWLCRVLRSIVVPFVCSPSAFRVRQPPSVVVLVVLVVARICTLKHICSWSITVSETLVVSTTTYYAVNLPKERECLVTKRTQGGKELPGLPLSCTQCTATNTQTHYHWPSRPHLSAQRSEHLGRALLTPPPDPSPPPRWRLFTSNP